MKINVSHVAKLANLVVEKDEIEKFSISPADVKVPYTFYKSDVPEKPLNPNNRCLFEDIRRFIGDF